MRRCPLELNHTKAGEKPDPPTRPPKKPFRLQYGTRKAGHGPVKKRTTEAQDGPSEQNIQENKDLPGQNKVRKKSHLNFGPKGQTSYKSCVSMFFVSNVPLGRS